MKSYTLDEKKGQTYIHKNQANTLAARDYKQPQCIALDRAAFNQGENALYDFTITEDISPTIVARGPNAVCTKKEGIWKTNI